MANPVLAEYQRLTEFINRESTTFARPHEARKRTAYDHGFTRIDRKPGFLTREAGVQHKAWGGVKRNPRNRSNRDNLAREAGDSPEVCDDRSIGSRYLLETNDPYLSPASRASNLLRPVPRANALGSKLSSASRTT
jgi:hypothetical protein